MLNRLPCTIQLVRAQGMWTNVSIGFKKTQLARQAAAGGGEAVDIRMVHAEAENWLSLSFVLSVLLLWLIRTNETWDTSRF